MEKINDVERIVSRFTDILVRTVAGEKLEPSVRWEWEECRIKLSASSLGLYHLRRHSEMLSRRFSKQENSARPPWPSWQGASGLRVNSQLHA